MLKGVVKVSVVASTMMCAGSQETHAEGRLFGFGDSQMDNGRLFREFGFGGDPTLGYADGRFSNGPTWVEYLHGIAGLSYDENNIYALGGAASDYTGAVDPFIPTGSSITSTGFLAQIDQLASDGITFTDEDVIGFTIGGNDITNLLRVSADPFLAVDAIAANMETALDKIADLGGKNIIVTSLFDRANYDYAAIGLLGVDSDEQTRLSIEINEVFRSIERDGINIHYLDMFELIERMQVTPEDYGFESVLTTDACYLNSCASLSADEQSRYLWMDYIHIGSAAQSYIADYAANLLSASTLTLANAQTGFAATTNVHKQAISQLGATGQPSSALSDNRLFVAPYLTSGDGFAGTDATSSSDRSYGGISFGGLVHINDNSHFGLIADFNRGTTSFDADLGENSITSGQVAALFGFKNGGFFANLGASAGVGSIEFERTGVFGDLTSDASARTLGVFSEFGYTIPMGSSGWTAVPKAAASFQRAKIGSYTESGDSLLAISVADQKHTQTLADLGLRMERNGLADGRMKLGIELLAAYEEREYGDLTYRQVNVPDRTLVETGGTQDDSYLRLGFDLEYALTEETHITFSTTGTSGRSGGDAMGVSAGVKVTF